MAIVLVPVVIKLGMARVVLDPVTLVIVLVLAAISAWLYFPGFHFATGDRDPGIYMEVGAHIARTGDLRIFSDAVADPHLPVQTWGGSALHSGLWIENYGTGLVIPQFYHLWSALLGAAYLVHGFGGESNLTPLIAVISVLLAALVARRIGGWIAAGATGLLLCTNMVQVWQAKYPSTEMLAQMLFLAALLAVLIAVQSGSKGFAALAGVFVGVGYLARADGVLIICLSVALLGVLWIFRKFDGRAWSYLAGMAIVSAYGVYQAYWWAGDYTRQNLPAASFIGGAVAAVIVISVVLRPVAARLVDSLVNRFQGLRARRTVGIVVVAGCSLLFILALIRPLFGNVIINYHGRFIRSYDERSIWWLSWFLTLPGLILMIAGIAVLVLRRWSLSGWIVIAVLIGILPLYLWHARNSPYNMWWVRRFTPTPLPLIIILIAVGLAMAWRTRSAWWGWVVRGLSVVAAVALVWVYLGQSLPLRSHDEAAGSYGVVTNLAALAGSQQGVFLWDPSGPCCGQPSVMFAGPLWLYEDQVSINLPRDTTMVRTYVADYLRHYKGKPLFVILRAADGTAAMKAQLATFTLTPVQHVQMSLPVWESSSTHRPDRSVIIGETFTVYRVSSR
ncbi:MAG: hypothetical protein ACR2P2_20825 [Nakamurella sp.]